MYTRILANLTVGLVPVCVGAARAAQLFERFLHEEEFSVPTGTEFDITCWALSDVIVVVGLVLALVWTRRPPASVENEGTGGAGSAGTLSDAPHLPGSPEPAGGPVRSRGP